MKTFNIVSRFDEKSKKISEEIKQELLKAGITISGNNPEIVIAVGGDGTVLEAYNKFGNFSNYIGVHTGSLGFYADWEVEEIKQLIECIKNNNNPKIVEYPLVEMMINGNEEKKYAINEIIVKSGNLSTFIMDVYINDEKFETFRGDGMIVSTPTGSTAYNYSVLGSILHPSMDVMQVSELAAINNTVYRTLNRSFVLPKHHDLKFSIDKRNEKIMIGVDGKELIYEFVNEINFKVSEEKMKFIRYKDYPFWQRVKEKFL